MKLAFLIAVSVMITIFWNVTTSRGTIFRVDSEDGDSNFLNKLIILDNMAPRPWRLQFEYTQ
jgi:hypothetical protein